MGGAVLGRPLDVRIQARPHPADVDHAHCLSAEVLQGDGTAGRTPSTVRWVPTTASDGVWLAQVRTDSPIKEPVVMVQLSVGCSSPVRRTYTLLTDLPDAAARSFENSSVRARPWVPDALVDSTSVARRAPAAEAARARSVPPAPVVVRRPAKVQKKVLPATSSVEYPSAPAPLPAPPAAAPARLVVEPVVGLVPEADGGPALPPQAIATTPAPLAPSTPLGWSEEQQKEQEQLRANLVALRANIDELRSANAQLQLQLEQVQQQRFSATVVYMLLGLLIALLASALWLWRRNRALWAAAAGGTSLAAGAAPLVPSAATGATPEAQPASATGAATPSSPLPVSPAQKNASLAAVLAPEPEARDVDVILMESLESEAPDARLPVLTHILEPAPTVEAAPQLQPRQLINPEAIFYLQQQAEFFISVGENEQAIGVMKKHIAENDTSSPLAYLELLRLYHSLGRTEDFAQLRAEFHRYFNAQVPEFAQFHQAGRFLLSYTETLAEIEAQWSQQEVLQALERCLFQRAESMPVFDLNAYDDLMLLYAIAQTTPAHTRGLPPPRQRTTPLKEEADAIEAIDEIHALVPATVPRVPPSPGPMSPPAAVASALPEDTGLSMDDFSWLPGQSLDTSANAPTPKPASAAVVSTTAAAISSPELAAALAKPTPEKKRILLDGEEFSLDFNLPADLEAEIAALSRPPSPSKP